MKKYNIFSNVVFILFVTCIALAVISLIFTLIDSNIYIDPSNKGMIDFYNHYQSTVWFLGVGITFLTLWATFRRIAQTEKHLEFIENQISSSGDQNRFINFYKHREEFIKTFSDHYFIKELSKANKCESRILLNELYSFMYYKSHKDFAPFVNNKFETIKENFFSAVENSNLNRSIFRLKNLEWQEINVIRKKIPLEILGPVYRFTQDIPNRLIPSEDSKIYIEEDKIKMINSFEFIMLHDIFYSLKLLTLLMTYDGITQRDLPYLRENIHIYRKELRLPFDLYSEL